MPSAPTQSAAEWPRRTIPLPRRATYRGRVKKVLLGLAMALVLALGGVGVANLAAGADHSGTGREHAPSTEERGKPDDAGQHGTETSTQMRKLAQQHRDGMRAWQQCHRSGGKSCQKPAPPGWLKHPEKHPGGWPPQHGKPDSADKGDGDDKAEKGEHGDRD